MAAAVKGARAVLDFIKDNRQTMTGEQPAPILFPPPQVQPGSCRSDTAAAALFTLPPSMAEPGLLQFYLDNNYLGIEDTIAPLGLTPLHFAALGGSPEAVRFLLSRGANIDARTSDKSTPLHYAVQSCSSHLIVTHTTRGRM